MKDRFKLYKQLFLSTLSLSAFTVGGGYVIVPLLKNKFVDELGLVDEEEMLNMIVIAQSSPGPIAVNASCLLGYKLGGFYGAFLTVLGAIIPPLITISIISYFYNNFKHEKIVGIILRGMQVGGAALIINVAINMGKSILKKDKIFNISLIILAFSCAFFLKINLLFIIIMGALIGFLKTYITHLKINKLKNSKRRKL